MARLTAYVGAACACLAFAPAGAQESAADVTLPSGRVVQLYETVVPDDDTGLLYMGFLAPFIGESGGPGFDQMSDDMDALCSSVGLRGAQGAEAVIVEIVIRLMAAPVPYGATDPSVVQFVNFYDITSGRCEWL